MVGEGEVEDHERRLLRRGEVESLARRRRLEHLVGDPVERVADDAPDLRLVVHHEHGHARPASGTGHSASSVIMNDAVSTRLTVVRYD